MRTIALICLGLSLTGCAAINAQLTFSKGGNSEYNTDPKVSGKATVRFYHVQEFRSLLESLEYRLQEKPK